MADELRAEPRIRGGIARLIGAADGGRPALSAFIVGLAGTAAFVVSLVVDWQRLSVPPIREFGIEGGDITVDLGGVPHGVAYPIGMLGLLTLVGLALPRPDLARRLRLAAVALGAGLAGVIAAIVNQMRDVWTGTFGYNLIFGGLSREFQRLAEETTFAPLPGQMLGFGAVVLLVAAVWLAGGPARARSAEVIAAPAHSGADDASAAPVSPTGAPAAVGTGPTGSPDGPPDHLASGVRVGQVGDLTVTASDAIDMSGRDILRS